MATSITIKEQMLQDINTTLEDILGADPKILIQENNYSQFANVFYLRENLQSSIDLFNELKNSNLEELPLSILENIKSQSNNFLTLISRFTDFNPNESSNPKREVNGYIDQATKTYNNLFSSYIPIINRSKISDRKFKSQEKELKKVITDSKKFVELFEKSSKATLKEIQDKAAGIVIVEYSEHFNREARRHKYGAYGWLAGGIIFFIAAFAFGYYYSELLIIPKSATLSEIVHNTVIKLFLISVIFSGIALCVKNYRANRHNQIIYTYKLNALATFKLFRDAAGEDEATKNAILVQAAQSIFSTPSTGYITSKSDSDSSNKIIEIVRNIGEKTQAKS